VDGIIQSGTYSTFSQ
jgi:hypothetical protein